MEFFENLYKEAVKTAGSSVAPLVAVAVAGETGLSAVGFTTGLAALGCGFGMAGGVVVVAAIGIGTYKLIEHLTE